MFPSKSIATDRYSLGFVKPPKTRGVVKAQHSMRAELTEVKRKTAIDKRTVIRCF